MSKCNKYIIVIIILIFNFVNVTTRNVPKEMIVNDFEKVHEAINVSVNRNKKGYKNINEKWIFPKLDHGYINSQRKLKYNTTIETIRENKIVSNNFIVQKVTSKVDLSKSIRKSKKHKRKLKFTSIYKKKKIKHARRDEDSKKCGVDSYEDDLYGCEFSDENQNKQKLNLVQLEQFSENQEEIFKDEPTTLPTKEENNQSKKGNQKSKEYNHQSTENDKVEQEEKSTSKATKEGNEKFKESDKPTTDYIPPDIEEDLEDLYSVSLEKEKNVTISNTTVITTSTPIIWFDGTVPKKQEVPPINQLCVGKARCRIPFEND